MMERSSDEFVSLVQGYDALQLQSKKMPRFPKELANTPTWLSLEKVERALEYIEVNCSVINGYQCKVSESEEMSRCWDAVPNVFDSLFTYNLIFDLPIDEQVTDAILRLIEKNSKPTHTWNYFFLNCPTILQDEVDTTTYALRTLFISGKLSLEETRTLVKELLGKITFYDNGLPETYLDIPGETNFFTKLRKNKKKIDIGVTCSLLWLCGLVGLDGESKLEPSFELLEMTLDALETNDESRTLAQYARYYKNCDILCYLISNVCKHSHKGRQRLQDKLCRTIRRRMNVDEIPTFKAFRLLTAFNLGLDQENDNDFRKALLKEAKNLYNKMNRNGAFQLQAIYNAHGKYYFGSDVLTTAAAISGLWKFLKGKTAASCIGHNIT